MLRFWRGKASKPVSNISSRSWIQSCFLYFILQMMKRWQGTEQGITSVPVKWAAIWWRRKTWTNGSKRRYCHTWHRPTRKANRKQRNRAMHASQRFLPSQRWQLYPRRFQLQATSASYLHRPLLLWKHATSLSWGWPRPHQLSLATEFPPFSCQATLGCISCPSRYRTRLIRLCGGRGSISMYGLKQVARRHIDGNNV